MTTSVSLLPPEGADPGPVVTSLSGHLAQTAVPVDVAVSASGQRIAVVGAGSGSWTELGPKRLEALGGWVETIPAAPARAPADPVAVLRGAEIFGDPAVGCAACHSGPALTNSATVAVGTGGAFQVPRLTGLAARAPYLHDGCAATLLDRFGPCGGGDQHGVTSHLTEEQLHDLVAFLESL